MHKCVFVSTRICSIIPHTVRVSTFYVLNIYLNLHFPTAEINTNSLRRVKNSCCKSISAAFPHSSVILPN